MTNPAASSKPGREWMPHFWEGCSFYAWVRLLARNRFAVQPRYWYVAAIVSVVSMAHSVLRFLQEAWYGDRLDRTLIRQAPIFIIGHWRTGTTLLHELLILDERHNYPNTYQCLEPNHFLLTERLITRAMPFLMPSRRPMDNMEAGWDRPQEDEFALCMMGQPSPYLTIAFPNHPPMDQGALDLEGLTRRERKNWCAAFLGFLRRLTFKDPRRLVLKSPTHTARIRTLLELFPDARFVHIVRNPYVVFPSTVNLWKSLYQIHGLQKPTFAGLEEHVFATFTRLYERLEEGRRLVAPARFYEVRYEDLVRDPEGRMRALYEHLNLGEFDRVLPRLRGYLAAHQGYKTNPYPRLDPELQAKIGQRWGAVIRRYGYTEESAGLDQDVSAPKSSSLV
jgi:hypothetical protein